MEHSLYPVPPRFTVRRLVLMDLAAICTLYGACGRDTAWAHAKRLPRCLAKANGGAVFWAESWLSAAPVYPPVPPRPRLPLCAARWRPRAFRPVFCCRPPPRPRAGPLPGAFFPCWANASGRPVPPPKKGSPPQSRQNGRPAAGRLFRGGLYAVPRAPAGGAAPALPADAARPSAACPGNAG